ncbi:MAG: hypothetical protein A2381_13190 [Bdellovibrionales bacterium RIFOXYB1_FULL_37_110]|nr:MAG: hypothetical protein A2181_02515 [Bdellovibrionales bacterium RIFOXYA1_FULL_38_20]OFZ51657.1 MAG: hypothetical protein A2417_12850 [Bdellovibrionales bacterium RIFOXYC1_FULL_37_79]OFZ60484.1 MAG: hypothetical protein A2381_13190 [Bdellovibrionales bacterium RIFOXYB1_FULL_37_110]OFZ65058.1 MAG: hypothetical protein A2577_09455 [Bdellovibrionales bacterium RIFOXYD1_FULL_36_51]
MKSLFLYLLLSFILILSQAFAAKGFQVKFSEGKNNVIHELQFALDDYSIEEVEADGSVWSKIIYGGNVTTNKKGFAELPFIYAGIHLRPKDSVMAEVGYLEYEDIQLANPLLPSKGVILRNQNPEEIPYMIDSKSVADEWYPATVIESSKPFILRDVRGINIYVFPFQYNAKRNILRVYKKVEVRVLKGRGVPVNPLLEAGGSIIPEMEDIYSTLLINYQRPFKLRNIPLKDFGKLLVLYPAQYKQSVAPYVEWKRMKGFVVLEKEVVKGTNVKNIIKQAYEADKDILYVQLFGDWDDLKSDLGPSQAPMDPMLGCVKGDDNYADLIVGRFSANTPEQVQIQVNKTIAYERNADPTDTWYKNAAGIASSEGGSQGDDKETDEQHMRIIRGDKLLKKTYVKVEEGYATLNVNSRNVSEWLNAGVGLINYTGHGSKTAWSTSGFKNSDIVQLNNGKKLPFIVSVACVNGEFHSSGGDSFAEAWLKKENGGAVAAWMSTINQPWAPPMRGQDYFNDLLIGGYDYEQNPGNGTTTQNGRSTFGSLTMNAASLMYAESSTGPDLDTIKTWTIFGDASLQVRSDTPKKLTISNDVVLMGTPYETVVSDSSGPVKNVIVSLYQNNKNYMGVTDENGRVEILNQLEVGEAQITVSGFNTQTISKVVQVIPPNGPYIVLKKQVVEDSNNSQADVGETIYLTIDLENVGGVVSKNLKVRLETNDTFVDALLDGEENVAQIDAGKAVTLKKGFRLRLKKGVEDQSLVPFKLVMVDHTNKEYRGVFSLKINAPKFSLSNKVVGDGEIKPGETRTIRYLVKNIGHVASSLVYYNLEELNELNINIGNAQSSIAGIAPGKEALIDFEMQFGNDIMLGMIAHFRFKISSDELETILDSMINVGLTDTFESGDFSSNQWRFGGIKPWEITEEFPFAGKYSARSGKNLGKNGVSELILTKNFIHDGSVSFYRMVSSEAKYDQLLFYVDGAQVGVWSGEVAWSEAFFNISMGAHELKWVYKKDYSTDDGHDGAWIDNLLLTGAQ